MHKRAKGLMLHVLEGILARERVDTAQSRAVVVVPAKCQGRFKVVVKEVKR